MRVYKISPTTNLRNRNRSSCGAPPTGVYVTKATLARRHGWRQWSQRLRRELGSRLRRRWRLQRERRRLLPERHFREQNEWRSQRRGYSVTCPDLAKTEFVSWEALHSYLDLYQKETFQVLRTRSTKSVAERNMQIKNAQNSSAEVIPDEWEVYAKTIICTHGGKYRCRGKGKRPRQEVRLMECTTQINACVQGVSEPPVKFAVCVTKTALTHNHKLGLRAYKHYLANRMSAREVGGAVRGAIEPMDLPAPGFEISSPIRARGRPKQKAKVNKAKKSTSIRMAKADSILHDKQLSLQTISDIVWHDTTYTNCAELLRQFQVFVFEKKMKPPVAHIIANLPTTKSIMAPAHISRILSKALLKGPTRR
ncbi:hypothetical protein PI124_g21165 [Phytophthora idaei]|nr:hypothetical protein PI124_g21165 [Phytophthora idaei]